MPADERGIGNLLVVVLDVRQLALRRPAKAGRIGPVGEAGHFQQHFGLGDERARVRQTESRPECVEGNHCTPPWLVTGPVYPSKRLRRATSCFSFMTNCR